MPPALCMRVVGGVRSQATNSANMSSQDQLVDLLIAEGVIRHRNVEAAMRTVDRRYFSGHITPQRFAYLDTPLPIGYDETISAPHMHASCLEMLHEHLKPGARVLD